LVTNLDFEKASMDGYVAYDGPVQPITGLLELLEGLRMWVHWTGTRVTPTCYPTTYSSNPVLIDPLDNFVR